MSTPADTFTDRTDATDEEFRARVAVFDAAEEPAEVVVIRAMLDLADNLDYYASKTTGGTHASGLEDAAAQIRAAVTALRGDRGPKADQPTTDEEGR